MWLRMIIGAPSCRALARSPCMTGIPFRWPIDPIRVLWLRSDRWPWRISCRSWQRSTFSFRWLSSFEWVPRALVAHRYLWSIHILLFNAFIIIKYSITVFRATKIPIRPSFPVRSCLCPPVRTNGMASACRSMDSVGFHSICCRNSLRPWSYLWFDEAWTNAESWWQSCQISNGVLTWRETKAN